MLLSLPSLPHAPGIRYQPSPLCSCTRFSGYPFCPSWVGKRYFCHDGNPSESLHHRVPPLINIHSYWKWPIYSGFTHWKWWFSIAMLVYQRVAKKTKCVFQPARLEFQNKGGLIEPQNVLWHHDPWPFLPRADTSGPKLSQIYMAMGTMGQNPGT